MARVFERPAFARARRLCLALPGTTESVSWGHPNFRAGRKTFCAFEVIEDRPSIAFRVPSATVARAVRRDKFFTTPYGRGLWVSTWVDRAIDWSMLEELVETSYRSVALKRVLKALDSSRNTS